MVCDEWDCNAHRRKSINGCAALTDVDFRDDKGNKIRCPFFKTNYECRMEMDLLEARGHWVCRDGKRYTPYNTLASHSNKRTSIVWGNIPNSK